MKGVHMILLLNNTLLKFYVFKHIQNSFICNMKDVNGIL